MKKHIVVAALFLGAPSYALSDDAENLGGASLSGFSWTGGYIGLNAGHAWGKSTADFDSPGLHSDNDPQGYLGGSFAGYNYQLDTGIVLGGEADFDFSSADNDSFVYYGSVPDYRDVISGRVNWTASLRARMGYAVDRVLMYGTAGVAIADFKVNETYIGVSPVMIGKTLTGWTAGAGIDYAVTDQVFARLEYRFSDFGSADSVNYPSWIPFKADLKSHDVRVGIAYKF